MSDESTDSVDKEECPECSVEHEMESFCANCDCCAECCECYTCEDCGEKTEEVCSNSSCMKCVVCCECKTCASCDRRKLEDEICDNCGSCLNRCCACCTCNNCDARVGCEYFCSECDCCAECCECRSCDRCGERYRIPLTGIPDTFCSDCNRCTDCGCACDNDDDDDSPDVQYPSGVTFHKGKRFDRIKSKRFAAVEIEVSDTVSSKYPTVTDVVQKWSGKIVSDGSLSGNNTFEINTAPASGDAQERQITEICAALSKIGASANKSCGLHIHVDFREGTYYDLRRLVILYAHIEEVLFSTQPRTRRSSNYCTPCGDLYLRGIRDHKIPKDSKKQVLRNVYGHDGRPPRKDKYDGARYHALNIHSWFYRGTIECRLHTGSVNAKKILQWIKLWTAIVDYAYAKSEKAIEYAVANTKPLDLLLSIAPDDEVRNYVLDRIEKFKNGANE